MRRVTKIVGYENEKTILRRCEYTAQASAANSARKSPKGLKESALSEMVRSAIPDSATKNPT